MNQIIGKIIADSAEKLKNSLKAVLEKSIAANEDKETFKLEFEKEVNRHTEAMIHEANDELELILADKQSAREMHKVSSQLQKVYAITFLSAYVFLTVGMLLMVYNIAVNNIHFPDWAIGFISTLWGAMSTKVSTITDFLFGSSFHSPEKPDKR